MVRSRHALFLRFCFAALIALALLLNGMGRVIAATDNGADSNTVVIAGTVVTLCQVGSDGDAKGKAHAGHSCDQCALRLAPILPQADNFPSAIRFPQVLTLSPASSHEVAAQFAWNRAWPRGPPAA